MSAPDPYGTEWSRDEIDIIVADYFDMLRKELIREHYVKAKHNARLQEATGRSKGSIEFKHQNISAVLRELGMPWLLGYKPMPNFQKALIDGVERLLDLRPHLPLEIAILPSAFAEGSALFFEQPPELVRASNDIDNSTIRRLVRKFDPAERDARNRSLGERGEERVLLYERTRLIHAGRDDLARKVRWVSREDGDGAGYDILSFAQNGAERLIEVKTTSGDRTTPFFLSDNELAFSCERVDAFRLVRVFDFSRAPKAFELAPPLDQHVSLKPSTYRASFGRPPGS